MSEYIETIQRLLDSDIKARDIERETGVKNARIYELRNGKRKLENLTLLTAERLYQYQRELDEKEGK